MFLGEQVKLVFLVEFTVSSSVAGKTMYWEVAWDRASQKHGRDNSSGSLHGDVENTFSTVPNELAKWKEIEIHFRSSIWDCSELAFPSALRHL